MTITNMYYKEKKTIWPWRKDNNEKQKRKYMLQKKKKRERERIGLKTNNTYIDLRENPKRGKTKGEKEKSTVSNMSTRLEYCAYGRKNQIHRP